MVLLEQQTVPIWVRIADWVLWGVFVFEYFALLAIAPNRWEYIKRNAANLAIVILSSPPLPAILDLVRLARLVRFIRLARLAGVTIRGLAALRAILGRRGLLYVASATVLIICAGGSGLALLEPQTVRGGFADGIWWAVVTASTVGYGDIAPSTLSGRLVAVVLMLTGVGLLSTLAASITAYFLEQDKATEMSELKERMSRMEALLIELVAMRNSSHAVGSAVLKRRIRSRTTKTHCLREPSLRFQKSIKIAPGIRINLSKSGLGVSAGMRGARVGVDSKGRSYSSVGIPGTGISQRTYHTKNTLSPEDGSANQNAAAIGVLIAIALFLVLVVIGFLSLLLTAPAA
jgi:voltage-gated potassium channel